MNNFQQTTGQDPHRTFQIICNSSGLFSLKQPHGQLESLIFGNISQKLGEGYETHHTTEYRQDNFLDNFKSMPGTVFSHWPQNLFFSI